MARTTRPVERGRGNGTEIVRFGCGKRHVYIGEAIADAGGGVTKPPGRSGWKGGGDLRRVYEFIYKSWHTRRPLFPDVDTMADMITKKSNFTKRKPA